MAVVVSREEGRGLGAEAQKRAELIIAGAPVKNILSLVRLEGSGGISLMDVTRSSGREGQAGKKTWGDAFHTL